MLFIFKYLPVLYMLISQSGNPDVDKARADFKKANEVFMQETLSVQMSYNFYKYQNDTKPHESSKGTYYKSGDNSYSNISGIESVRTKNSVISIQQEEKILVISNAAKQEGIKATANISDSLFNFCSSVIRQELPDGLVKYTLIFDKKYPVEFEKLDVIIHQKTHAMQKIVLYYPKMEVPEENDTEKMETIHPKYEISFSNYSKILPENKNIFQESNYVKQEGKIYKGVGKYSAYRIYNQKLNK